MNNQMNSLGSVSNLSAAITLVFVLLFVIFIVGYYLVGRLLLGRTSAKSYARLIITACSALLAFLLAKGIYFLFGNVINDLIYRYVPQIIELFGEMSQTIGQAIEASASLEEYVASLIVALTEPFLFVALFVEISLISKIVALIVFEVNKNKTMKVRQRFLRRCMNAGIAVVCAIISFGVITVPIVGYANYATDVYAELEQEELIPSDTQFSQIFGEIDKATDSPLMKLHWKLSRGAFASLTTVRTRGSKETLSVREEISVYRRIAIEAMALSEVSQSGTFNAETIAVIDNILDEVDKSDYLTKIFAELLQASSNCWINNQSFCGYNVKESVPEDLHGVVDVILQDFVVADRDEVIGNLKVITNAVTEVLQVADELKDLDTSDILKIDTALINDSIDKISNVKVKEVVVEIITSACEKWKAGESFMDINVKEGQPDLSGAIDVLLDELASVTTENVVEEVKSIISLLQPINEITDTVSTLDMTDVTNIDTASLKNVVNVIDENEILRKVMAAVLSEAGAKWNNGETFLGAQLMGAEGQIPLDFQGTVSMLLSEFETANESTIVEKLNVFIDFADMVGKVYGSFNTINLGTSEIVDCALIDSVVAILQENASLRPYVSKLLNDAGTKWDNGESFFEINLREQINGLDPTFANFFDTTINRLKSSTSSSVISDLQMVSSTFRSFRYAQSLSGSEINVDELSQTLEDVVINITPENADDVKGMITPEVLQGTGLSAENSEAVSQILSNTIDGIQSLDSESKAQEAQALNNLIVYAKESGEGTSQVDTTEMLNSVVNSQALSSSVKDYAQNSANPAITLTETQKASVETSLSEMEATASAEDLETISALKVLFGVSA
ncbi:MAG: hypothetical protein ACI4M6_00485 [Christensenellaceae bacterium]